MKPADQRIRYKNPPIEEAVCELRFKPGQDWNLTIPGKLQSALGDEYTGKPQEQRVIGFGLEQQGDNPPSIRFGEGLERVQLVTEAGKRMVGVGQDLISIHMLHPYHDPSYPEPSGWSEFYCRIKEALKAYYKVAEPIGVFHIGVRYINKIVIPNNSVEAGGFLKCALPVINELPDKLVSSMSRVEYAYDDDVHLVLSQGSSEIGTSPASLLLDIDVMWRTDSSIAESEVLAKITDLHEREKEVFEAVITDNTRGLFDAD